MRKRFFTGGKERLESEEVFYRREGRKLRKNWN
jgi:hypothetical protein